MLKLKWKNPVSTVEKRSTKKKSQLWLSYFHSGPKDSGCKVKTISKHTSHLTVIKINYTKKTHVRLWWDAKAWRTNMKAWRWSQNDEIVSLSRHNVCFLSSYTLCSWQSCIFNDMFIGLFTMTSSMGGHPSSNEDTRIQYPLRLMQPRINDYIKVFQIDLERLQQHTANIRKVRLL